jgi:hypothetical protein
MSTRYNLARYVAAFFLIFYGFAKVNGAQFLVMDSVLDQPMGSVSGFWLTWHYFGATPIYKAFTALLEIGAGLMLMFRRTTLLGAVLTTGIMVHIAVIGIAFGIGLGPLVVVLIILTCTGTIFQHHREAVMAVLWPKLEHNGISEGRRVGTWFLPLAFVLTAFFFHQWVYDQTVEETPLVGKWRMVSGPEGLPDVIYFEENRAFYCVLRKSDRFTQRRYAIDGNQLEIHHPFKRDKQPVFKGAFHLDGDRLRLEGKWNDQGEVTLVLIRAQVPGRE